MNETNTSTKRVDPLLILGIIAVVAVVGFILIQSRTTGTENTDRTTQLDDSDAMQEENSIEETTVNEDPEVMEKKDVEDNNTTMEDKDVIEVTIDGGDFFFKPNEIKVKKGEKVKIVFNNTGGFHDFVIDEFDVKTKQFNGPDKVEIEFTPDKAGEFEFYCSVGQHRANGMSGTLIVEEV